VFAVAASSSVAFTVVGSRVAEEGRAYAQDVLPRICQPWDAGAIADRATPELLASMSSEQLATFIAFLEKRLGPLRRPGAFQNMTWEVRVGTSGLSATTIQFADCEFEKAPARITLTLVRHDGVWLINGFHANSDELIK